MTLVIETATTTWVRYGHDTDDRNHMRVTWRWDLAAALDAHTRGTHHPLHNTLDETDITALLHAIRDANRQTRERLTQEAYNLRVEKLHDRARDFESNWE